MRAEQECFLVARRQLSLISLNRSFHNYEHFELHEVLNKILRVQKI